MHATATKPQFFDRFGKAVRDPGLVKTWVCAKMISGWGAERHVALSRSAGLQRSCFVLSFDCDTDRDSAVVGALHARLRSGGLSPLYAVAGEVLAAAGDVYRAIARDGAVFLNHGFRRHAGIDPESGSIVSTFFYDAVPPEEWQRDIRLGGEAVSDILGDRPTGFRTPHFGSFERPRDLRNLWSFLAQNGYAYSTSTRPLFGLRYGPFFKRSGIVEFPVSGCLGQPEQILDSWGLVRNGDSGSARLNAELAAYLELMKNGGPVLLNIYLDPADIAECDEVIDTLCKFAQFSVPSFQDVMAYVGAR